MEVRKDTPVQDNKNIKKVTTGTVKVKKKSFIEKFFGSFIAEDAGSVKDYIIDDILIPGIKKGIYDVIVGGLEKLFGTKSSARRTTASTVSYRDYYDRNKAEPIRPTNRGYEFDDILFDTKDDANEVLESMYDILDRYAIVSVADYYDLIGQPAKYTDNNYGWDSLTAATLVRYSNGYGIKLPKVKPIK